MTRIHIINHRNYDKYLDWDNYGPFMGTDFDGVLNTYDGSKGWHANYDPDPLAAWFMNELVSKGYKVIIVTARRDLRGVIKWLRRYKLDDYVYGVTNLKVPFICLGDDRCEKHNGDLKDLAARMLNFNTYWELRKISTPQSVTETIQADKRMLVICPSCNTQSLSAVWKLGMYEYVECPFCHAKVGV
jgi:hypothetical protein